MQSTVEAEIAEAFDRIQDFLAVQGDRLSVEAVNLLQQSVGIDDSTRATFAERIDAFGTQGRRGEVLFGVIVGLLAAQLEAERR